MSVTTVVEVDMGLGSTVTVLQSPVGSVNNPGAPCYQVVVDGVIRHGNCSAEDVMRALGNYLHSVSFELKKANNPNLFF